MLPAGIGAVTAAAKGGDLAEWFGPLYSRQWRPVAAARLAASTLGAFAVVLLATSISGAWADPLRAPCRWADVARGHQAPDYEAPPNDHLATAITIPAVPWTYLGNTTGATSEPQERSSACRAGAGLGVWFRYDAPRTHALVISTSGSDFDTVLSVWMGDRHPLREIACDDDVGPADVSSRLQVGVREKTSVYLKVESAGEAGNLVLTVTPALLPEPPANDDLAQAWPIARLPFAQTVDSSAATEESYEAEAPCATATGAGIWYRYDAATDQALRFDTGGSGFDTVLSIWTGEHHPLRHLACNDDVDRHSGDTSSAIQWHARRGDRYWLRLGASRGRAGVANLAVAEIAPGPPGDDLRVALAIHQFPAQFEVDTTWASTEPGEEPSPCDSNVGHSVWWAIEPPASTRLRIERGSSEYPTVASLWRGDAYPLQHLACAPAPAVGAEALPFEVDLIAGECYRLKVEGIGDYSGWLVLRLEITAALVFLPLVGSSPVPAGP